MTAHDIEIGLTEEDRAIRDTVHKFAELVLRPTGRALDRMPDPGDVIAPTSPLWEVFRRYNELGLGRIMMDTEMDPVRKARLTCIINEELSWGDVGLAVAQKRRPALAGRSCRPDSSHVTAGSCAWRRGCGA